MSIVWVINVFSTYYSDPYITQTRDQEEIIPSVLPGFEGLTSHGGGAFAGSSSFPWARRVRFRMRAPTVWFLVGNGAMGYWDYYRGP